MRIVRNVYVVTHPEASHHVDGVVGGWHDSELTEAGRKDTVLIADAIRMMVPQGATAELHSSDLKRTMAVATEISGRLGIPVVTNPGLREKSYGEAEGKPQAWLDDRFVPPPATGDRMGHFEGVTGAETKREFAARIYAAVDRTLSGAVEHVVIVTHGFALTFVVAAWSRLPIESLGYTNLRATSGGITVLREDDYFHNRQVVTLNSVNHLGR